MSQNIGPGDDDYGRKNPLVADAGTAFVNANRARAIAREVFAEEIAKCRAIQNPFESLPINHASSMKLPPPRVEVPEDVKVALHNLRNYKADNMQRGLDYINAECLMKVLRWAQSLVKESDNG